MHVRFLTVTERGIFTVTVWDLTTATESSPALWHLWRSCNKTRHVKKTFQQDILTKIDNRHTFQKHWTKTQFPAGWAETMDWFCLCWALPLFAFLRTGFSVQFPSPGSMRDIHWTSHINTHNIIWVYIMIFTILPAICPKACI